MEAPTAKENFYQHIICISNKHEKSIFFAERNYFSESDKIAVYAKPPNAVTFKKHIVALVRFQKCHCSNDSFLFKFS